MVVGRGQGLRWNQTLSPWQHVPHGLCLQNACSLLGYGKGELDGKNINMIMPPPFSQRHNRYIRQYIQTGRECVLSSVNTVVALHKARYVLPVKLAVSKVSGATEGGYSSRLSAPAHRASGGRSTMWPALSVCACMPALAKIVQPGLAPPS